MDPSELLYSGVTGLPGRRWKPEGLLKAGSRSGQVTSTAFYMSRRVTEPTQSQGRSKPPPLDSGCTRVDWSQEQRRKPSLETVYTQEVQCLCPSMWEGAAPRAMNLSSASFWIHL